MVWQQELETKLDGGVVSLSVLADSCELLAGTQEGSVYRLLLADLSASKVREMPCLGRAKMYHFFFPGYMDGLMWAGLPLYNALHPIRRIAF